MSRSAFHYVRAAITGCRGWVEAFGLNGAVFDTVAIDRCTPPPATGGPFRGVRATIPGDVQAEHFDEGGANVGYRDADPENLGGQFRATGVDIRATSDVGGGYNIGWMTAGEWLAYSVDITRPGVYTISARVAAAAAGGVFHIEVDDTDVTGPLAVPNTGGWQTWQSVDKTGSTAARGTAPASRRARSKRPHRCIRQSQLSASDDHGLITAGPSVGGFEAENGAIVLSREYVQKGRPAPDEHHEYAASGSSAAVRAGALPTSR